MSGQSRHAVFPALFTSPGAVTVTNFGQTRFVYDIEQHVRRWTESSDVANTIPSEVVALVVEFTLDDFDLYSLSRTHAVIKAQKHDIGAYRLTCRYWSQLFTSCLYRKITLHAEEDLRGLIDVVARNPIVAPLVQSLTLEETGPLPWVHRGMLSPVLRTLTNLKLIATIGSTDDSSASPWAAVPPALSRAAAYGLTFQGVPHVTTLCLGTVELPSLAYLVQALLRLPQLKQLTAVHLGWLSEDTQERFRRHPLPQLRVVKFVNTRDDAMAPFFLLNSRLDNRRDNVWSANRAMFKAIIDVCRLFYATMSAYPPGYTRDVCMTTRCNDVGETDHCTSSFGIS